MFEKGEGRGHPYSIPFFLLSLWEFTALVNIYVQSVIQRGERILQ